MRTSTSTRGKNKRNRPEDNADAVTELYRKIHLTDEVTEDDMNQLYMISKPVCQGCRVNNKDNPNCFCGLIPSQSGSRKTGLWQKTSEIVHSFGPDPSKDLRPSLDSPAGLTNLGATCYANSILQFLYMNKSFRDGVFSAEPEVLKEKPVLNQLARLFAQLHASKMTFVESAPFIETLELDNSIQQDCHEFLTLLFSLLEGCLSCSKISKARTVVQDLFRGGVSHVTKCLKCGNQSEVSSKVEDFYGLELNVKGLKSLDESLDDYLASEELQGENQYFCGSCDVRVNATRSTKLLSLPPVLNFQLKRCIFLPNTTTKKKITSAFSFPGELDMTCRLAEHSQSKLIYELSAVLIHKGSTVNSGHYVAHIKDEDTEQWWEFDDESVSSLGIHPFGKDSSSLTTKPLQNGQAVDPSNSEPKEDDAINGNPIDIGKLQSSSDEVNVNAQSFCSTDAYMLMYSLKRSNSNNNCVKGQLHYSRKKSKNEEHNSGGKTDSSYLPSHLLEEVTRLNVLYSDSCQKYKAKKESELSHVNERRQEVRSVLSEAPVHTLEEPWFWISTDWLRQWADNITSLKIDNTPIQCLHGKVLVSKIGSMKRLSAKGWTLLFSQYDGGPTLSREDYCIACVLETARSMVSANSYRDGRSSMRELAEAALSGKCPDGTMYYVSRTWLQQWLRRKNIDTPSEADTGPTASIRCPHGELMPEQATGAKRTLVPENLWTFIHDSANAIKPDDMIGCLPFPSNSETCDECSLELTEVTSLEYGIRDFKLKQRQSHDKLALGKSIALHPCNKYYLLPSSWLSKWRNYITASGKNATSFPEPETLSTVIDSLKCDQHSRLLERPPNLIERRGMILQKSPSADGLTLITETDWKLFCKDWNGMEERGIYAEIEFNNSMEDDLLGASDDLPVSVENMPSPDEVNGEAESQGPTIKTFPEVCEDCIGERESCELMQKLNYCNEDICIYFIHGKEPPKYILEAPGNMLESNRRSKRSRKTAAGDSINLNVSGSTSIYQLKMMIWQSFGIVKENQILHKGSKIIDGESATLADVNVLAGDTLWVTDSEVHENRDIADELSDQKMEEVPKAEKGFRGSLLTSNISHQVVSEPCFN